jgi:hypothetical protein
MLTQQIADVNGEWTPDWTKQDTFCIKLNLDNEPYVFDKPYSQAFLAFDFAFVICILLFIFVGFFWFYDVVEHRS